MPSTTISPAVKRRAMLRAQARINPNLAAGIREDIHNLTVCRRRVALQITGDLNIPTTASTAKLRIQLGDLDAEILRLRQDLALLQP